MQQTAELDSFCGDSFWQLEEKCCEETMEQDKDLEEMWDVGSSGNGDASPQLSTDPLPSNTGP